MESPSEYEVRSYFTNKIQPIFSKLMENIIKAKPEDILDFSIKYFKDKKTQHSTQRADNNSESEDEGDINSQHETHFQTVSDKQFLKWKQQKLKKGRKKRIGISSDAYRMYGRRNSFKITKGFKKDQNSFMSILFFCMNSFLFRNFTQSEITSLITMMQQKNTTANQIIFREGQFGDCIYFVEEGIFECYQQLNNNEPQVIKFYHKGDTFGQIALLHVMNRQASIKSKTNGILYTLDRESYTHFKKMCMTTRRTIYNKILKKQSLFNSFKEEQLEKICDVLIQVSYEENDIIINEGDVGKRFYIILEGILVAYKGPQENIVQCYKQGDAFGQIALIKQVPRQASVKALTRCRLVYMTRHVFNRIFKSINLDKQIDKKYGKNHGYIINKRRE